MEQKKRVKTIFGCIAFWGIFCLILTVLTLLYLPKWKADTESNGGLASFYKEPRNTISVIGVGSCNLYTSYSPLLAYEEFGYTSFLLTCPDQQMMTSYYLVKEALARQDVKVVVVEALFLTENFSSKRELYDRESLEYLPWSFNKLQMTIDTVKTEVKAMQSFDPNSPGEALTMAGYLFPLLRYHDKTEFSEEDITFYFSEEGGMYGRLKGSYPAFDRTNHNTLEMDDILNGYEIKEDGLKWFLKIQDLCKKEGMELLLVKSPNIYRWNDELNEIIQNFAKEYEVDYLDFGQEEFGFTLEDYSYSTGRLNAYGQKKLTHHLGEYIASHYEVPKFALSTEDNQRWQEDISYLYNLANENSFSFDPGEIQRATNIKEGIQITWNEVPDASSYAVYRIKENEQKEEFLGETKETFFVDAQVFSGEGYTYFLSVQGGSQDGKQSKKVFHVFVATPAAFDLVNGDLCVYASWSPVENADNYEIGVRRATYYPYSYLLDTRYNFIPIENEGTGRIRLFIVRARINRDDKTFYSDSISAENLFLRRPVISSVQETQTGTQIAWDDIYQLNEHPSPHYNVHEESMYPKGGISWSSEVEIYRAPSGTTDFKLIDTVNGEAKSYTDKEKGNYDYRIRAKKTVSQMVYVSNFSTGLGQKETLPLDSLKDKEGKPYIGLWAGEDGIYYLFYDGQWLQDYNGFYESRDGKSYYIEGGYWTRVSRLVKLPGGTYYLVKRGLLDIETTLYHSPDGNTYYIENGIWDRSFSGEITEEGITYKFENGMCKR